MPHLSSSRALWTSKKRTKVLFKTKVVALLSMKGKIAILHYRKGKLCTPCTIENYWQMVTAYVSFKLVSVHPELLTCGDYHWVIVVRIWSWMMLLNCFKWSFWNSLNIVLALVHHIWCCWLIVKVNLKQLVNFEGLECRDMNCAWQGFCGGFWCNTQVGYWGQYLLNQISLPAWYESIGLDLYPNNNLIPFHLQ